MQTISTQTLILGSGAAGLNAAVSLKRLGVDDLIVLTEGLQMGTSINTGSDKQTYYKLSLCDESDSPELMAQSYFAGGSMHGDLALVESAGSVRGFMNLVTLGVPFPFDSYGRYIGYKTDHDPFRRATSVGPYTSREMCRALIAQIPKLNIRVEESWTAIEIQPTSSGGAVLAVNAKGELAAFEYQYLVFAVGGPAGLYKTSVYPVQQTGAIGLALRAGAAAEGLPESQFGLASVSPRWNVSGTYMQVVPRFVSAAVDSQGMPVDPLREFLPDYYADKTLMFSDIFRKGYQWPFDSGKVPDGSSMIDLYVYRETVEKGKKVFLDFRSNAEGFSFDLLDSEAREYLEKSGATQATPLERLQKMNPGAYNLYRDFGVDLALSTLEIALCAQHNNGGLAVNTWYESSIDRLFAAGEVAGTHGVKRPGGSALNAGQVGSLRAAQKIKRRLETTPSTPGVQDYSNMEDFWTKWFEKSASAPKTWQEERNEFQTRMSAFGAAIRKKEELKAAVADAKSQYERILKFGCRFNPSVPHDAADAASNVQLCFAHWVYLESILFALESGVGSRGSALILAPESSADNVEKVPEDVSFREKVLQTKWNPISQQVENAWIPRRPIPQKETWFESDWAKFRDGSVFEE